MCLASVYMLQPQDIVVVTPPDSRAPPTRSRNEQTLRDNFATAKRLENVDKNRYRDIMPYDYSRVLLRPNRGVPGSDYINASYIKVRKARPGCGSVVHGACGYTVAHGGQRLLVGACETDCPSYLWLNGTLKQLTPFPPSPPPPTLLRGISISSNGGQRAGHVQSRGSIR